MKNAKFIAKNLFYSLRVEVGFSAFSFVVASGFAARADLNKVIFCGVLVALIGTFANILNDFCDAEKDTLKNPPKMFSNEYPWTLFAAFALLGLVIVESIYSAYQLNLIEKKNINLLSAIFALTIVYNSRIVQRIFPLPNIVCALCWSLPSFMFLRFPLNFVYFALSFLLIFFREVFKDAEDIEVDEIPEFYKATFWVVFSRGISRKRAHFMKKIVLNLCIYILILSLFLLRFF